jgi:hypothetical protein
MILSVRCLFLWIVLRRTCNCRLQNSTRKYSFVFSKTDNLQIHYKYLRKRMVSQRWSRRRFASDINVFVMALECQGRVRVAGDWLSSSTNDENIGHVRTVVHSGRRKSIQEVPAEVGISVRSVYSIHRNLNMHYLWRMPSSGMLHRVALVRTDVSEELSSSFSRVTRIAELGTTLAITSNRRTLQRNT